MTCDNAFHGRTLAIISASGKPGWDQIFAPMPQGFVKARYNDIDSVERGIGPQTAAIMIEPVQGEAGVQVADPSFLRNLRSLATKNRVLLVFDEVQTGIGRCGTAFAFQHVGVEPDIMTLAKGIGGAVPLSAWAQTAGHAGLGPVQPRAAMPDLPLTLHSGRQVRSVELLRGKVTALQLMFTGCSSTCPIQGAIFESLQGRLAQTPSPEFQLLSISIDPLADDARALAAWRQRFNAQALWIAATPGIQHNDRLPDFLSSRPKPGSTADRHTAQVYLMDSRGRLAFRLAELASASAIAKAMSELARLG